MTAMQVDAVGSVRLQADRDSARERHEDTKDAFHVDLRGSLDRDLSRVENRTVRETIDGVRPVISARHRGGRSRYSAHEQQSDHLQDLSEREPTWSNGGCYQRAKEYRRERWMNVLDHIRHT